MTHLKNIFFLIPKHKLKFMLIIFSIVITASFFSFLSVAYAQTYVNNPDEITNVVARLAYIWAENIFNVDFINSVSDIVKIDVGMSDLVNSTSPINTGAVHYDLWSVAESVYNAIKIVGIGFVTLYFLIGLIDKAQTEQFNMEHFFKAMLKYGITLIFLLNGFTLFAYVLNLGNALVNTVQTAITYEGDDAQFNEPLSEYFARAKNCNGHFFVGTLAGMGMLLELCIPYICMFLAKIIIYVLVYSRLIELFLRAAFMPIGIADMFNGNGNGTGVRYIKKLFATAFQGALIVAILTIYSILISSTQLQASLSGPLIIIVVTFSVISLIMKSQTWANEILGI